MTACLGVILDKEANTQTFFGGGEVENSSKQVSSTRNSHNNDIMSLNVNTAGDRTLAVTGQVGKNPPVFVWNTQTGEKIFRTQLAKNARGVSACAINTDGSMIATADQSNDHIVSVFNTASGDCIYTDKGGPDPIHDMSFCKGGSMKLWSAGVKHLNFYDLNAHKKKKGIFGDHPRVSFACITADDKGTAYSGGTNAKVYVWGGNTCK